MDPNATLTQLKEEIDHVATLLDHILALDTWLSAGGFLPNAWQHETGNGPQTFQMISRTNDRNGNAYRLMLVYAADGTVVGAYEARSSAPNHVRELTRRNLWPLPAVHLAPGEYNTFKRRYKAMLQHVD